MSNLDRLAGLEWRPTGRRDTSNHVLLGRVLAGMTPRARVASLRYYWDFFVTNPPDAIHAEAERLAKGQEGTD